MFTKMIGAGVFIRYNGGSIDLPDATGLNAGGFQLGIGGTATVLTQTQEI